MDNLGFLFSSVTLDHDHDHDEVGPLVFKQLGSVKLLLLLGLVGRKSCLRFLPSVVESFV